MRKVKFWMDGATPDTKKVYCIDIAFCRGGQEIQWFERIVPVRMIPQLTESEIWATTKEAAKAKAMARFQRIFANALQDLKTVKEL